MLSQADRIAFSKKIVEVPFLIASVKQSKASIVTEKAKAQALDTAHKNLVDGKTTLINAYQSELIKLDGITRSTLPEQDLLDSANFVLGNNFYPNDINNPPPSLAPNVWTKTKPYAKNKAVGKFYNEAYGATVPIESDSVAPANAAITAIEGTYTPVQRATGQHCIITGSGCSLGPSYSTQAACLAAMPTPGVWSNGYETIVTFPEVHTDLADLISKINTYKSYLQAEVATIYLLDSNTTRKTESQAAANNINNIIIPAINAWLALADFDTNHMQAGCTNFNNYDISLLNPTKLRPAELNILKAAISSRASFIVTRQAQLIGYLGSVTQDLSTGEVTGVNLYFERWSFIQLRLALLGGSLLALKGFERAESAQNDQISNYNIAVAAYALFLKCSQFQAPATGTKFISVKSAADFVVGDNVFIISETQPEIVRSIASIVGNRIELGQPVPENYRHTDFARIYKDLS